MICTNCGYNMPENAPICPACGQEIKQSSPKPKKIKTGMVIVIILAAMVLQGGINAFRIAASPNLGDILIAYQQLGGVQEPAGNQPIAAYNAAVELLEKGKYVEALAAFQALGDYRDSRAKVSECAYGAAKQCLDQGDYAAALRYREMVFDERKKKEIFDRYYEEYCADLWAKADLFRAIEGYYDFLNAQTESVEQLEQMILTSKNLLLPYETAHFYDSQLQSMVMEYCSAVDGLLSAAQTGDMMVYQQACLQLNRVINRLQVEYALVQNSNILPTIAYYQATSAIKISLIKNFEDLLPSAADLPYDWNIKSHYFLFYNNTIYKYTLSYQIHYYDRAGNLLQSSRELTQEIYATYYTNIPMPIDETFSWDHYDVTYQIQIEQTEVTKSSLYAVRLLDEEGNPIQGAYVSFSLKENSNLHDVQMGTTDRYGVARLPLPVDKGKFWVYISMNPNFNHVEKTYTFQCDGWVYDVVVERDVPDFSVTVVDTDGNPISGVTMHLATTDVFTASKYGKTDENGYVCWYDVDLSHTYKISGISKHGYVYIYEVYYEPGENHIIVVLEKNGPPPAEEEEE